MTVSGTAIITGAARGLGLQVARRLLSENLDMLVLADLDLVAAETAAEQLSPGGTELVVAGIDVSDRASVSAVIASAVEATGHIDVLINNAGVLPPSGRVHNLDVADWQRCFDVNVMGAVNGIWAAVPHMRRKQKGVIINTASVAGLTPFTYASAYSASKAAIIALTKCAALEYARDNIRVNCVCPGTFRSAIHDGLPERALEAMALRHPLGLGNVADVAGAFAFLAGDDSRWTTGSALIVDGGYSAQ
jgi:NAD(P)-dependent dehydrogenase (short-subunit alcohol dehydrogenase family)